MACTHAGGKKRTQSVVVDFGELPTKYLMGTHYTTIHKAYNMTYGREVEKAVIPHGCRNIALI